ncbi:MAG: tetratricopeptide repeat protein [Myxococcales bacterium]|nr:tetratricopeptide repeat protein [Myxococcales bacterium]
MRRASPRAVVAVSPLLRAACFCAALGALPASAQSLTDLTARTETAAALVKKAANDVELVERQYTLVDEQTDEAALLARFSDAEIRKLLGDYATASVLFYDLVANKDFQKTPRYIDALYSLADSLYEMKNYLGARLYLRQVLDLRGKYYKQALAKYLEIAGRLNFFVGIDEYITQARGLSGGALPAELSYVYGKWLFSRDDLEIADRVPRAQAVFDGLAREAGGPLRLQSIYFIGVGHVRLKAWDKAIESFTQVTKMTARDARDRKVQELAEVSLGRVYFEVAKYDEAVEHYSHVPQQSDNFPDSLYEIAWCYVRKGELRKAKDATEVLLLVAENSVLAPEAKILQGTLLQKLQNYDEALDTYNGVINEYAPVRDEIQALLTVNKDPVAYFDELLARNEKTLDVTKLLPTAALKWASTRDDVADAVAITNALDESRKGLADSRDIATRILKSLDERGVDSFPLLQEGYSRAAAVETIVTRAEEALTEIEGQLVGSKLSPEQQQQLEAARAQEKTLKARIETLPTTSEQLSERKARIQGAIDALEKQAFQLSIEAQSHAAQLVAVRKYVDDTRAQRKGGKTATEDEKAFLERVTNEQNGIDATLAEIDDLRKRLAAERNNADKAASGEDALRKQYTGVLDQERAIFNQLRAGLPDDNRRLLGRIDVVRADADALKDRVNRAKGTIRERVQRRAQKLRDQVLAEATLLEGFSKDTDAITGETRNLVGRIAFDSFRRVQKSFYDLVLKADVGVVDVSFQRKQDKTSEIQKKSAAKDRELKQLEDEFKDVLKDVD